MKLLGLVTRTYRGSVILGGALLLVTSICTTLIIATIARAVSPEPWSWPLVVSFLALCALMLTSMFTSDALLVRAQASALGELRADLSRRILAANLSQLEHLGEPRLTAGLVSDVNVIAASLPAMTGLAANTSLLIGCIAYLAWLSLALLPVALCFAFMTALIFRPLLARARRAIKGSRDQEQRLFTHFEAIVRGTVELKSHRARRQDLIATALLPTIDLWKQHWSSSRRLIAVSNVLGYAMFFGAVGTALYVGRRMALPVEVLSGYALTIVYMVSILEGLLACLDPIARANVALEKIEDLDLSLAAEVDAATRGPTSAPSPAPGSGWSSLELRGVVHARAAAGGDRRFVLGPIDLLIRPGEILFIVGGNGSGKSTLAKVLAGLYVPDSGLILLDGAAIGDERREWYRQHFSVVLQSFFLFDRLYGMDANGLDERARQYLVELELDGEVGIRDGIFSTTSLSQGQRKRLALLTAYLEDRPIYIFDEWAADQDPVFKRVFYTRLVPELRSRGKAVVVITHDERYFQLADELLKLEDGKAFDEETSAFLARLEGGAVVARSEP